MARTASGSEVLKQAEQWVVKAETVEELRQAQAVLLPLDMGLSMEQTARALGVSKGWACQLRRRFIAAGGEIANDRPRPGGRRRQNLTQEQEAEFLRPYLDQARQGGLLIVGSIKQALDQRLGREVALASVYNLLHRHGWRKLAPDKRHIQADVDAQEDWKKNSAAGSKRSGRKSVHRSN